MLAGLLLVPRDTAAARSGGGAGAARGLRAFHQQPTARRLGVPAGIEQLTQLEVRPTLRWRELDSNCRFRARCDATRPVEFRLEGRPQHWPHRPFPGELVVDKANEAALARSDDGIPGTRKQGDAPPLRGTDRGSRPG